MCRLCQAVSALTTGTPATSADSGFVSQGTNPAVLSIEEAIDLLNARLRGLPSGTPPPTTATETLPAWHCWLPFLAVGLISFGAGYALHGAN